MKIIQKKKIEKVMLSQDNLEKQLAKVGNNTF